MMLCVVFEDAANLSLGTLFYLADDLFATLQQSSWQDRDGLGRHPEAEVCVDLLVFSQVDMIQQPVQSRQP